MKSILKILDRAVGLQNMTLSQVKECVEHGLQGEVLPGSIEGYSWEWEPYLTDWGEVRVRVLTCGYGPGCFWAESDYPL